jgi:ABC-type ATPase involved in cell division
VAVARAFAGRPEVIFADEPISNLDPANRQAVLSLLEEYHRSGHTVVLSVHDSGLISLPCTV